MWEVSDYYPIEEWQLIIPYLRLDLVYFIPK